ncbi:hypothetical protein CONLIGDRAFT_348144 [Coniochaeta ligniaria NRRL 30616]|uniref:Uncharacterized protein n=1 Tax=Coniochaeta ligniaria NRRL 30616 TaxID=1408157 RepID=A0A1J7IR95_9PEZI|nr:hypothetical protein CONLIGDRAFT_348144 [Coniochaeta ligniaria NRRL 30616]
MDWQSILWTTWMVIFTATFLLIKILYWPVSVLFSVILALLSPVFFTVQYCLRPFFYVYSILPRLQPLYLFFGSAAFVGILAGVALLLTSNILTSVTGMQYDERDDKQELIEHEGSTGTATPVKRLDDVYSSQESEWQWLDKVPDSRRRRTPGLLGQTILEEDDDS